MREAAMQGCVLLKGLPWHGTHGSRSGLHASAAGHCVLCGQPGLPGALYSWMQVESLHCWHSKPPQTGCLSGQEGGHGGLCPQTVPACAQSQ
jgi:hypothetical protein